MNVVADRLTAEPARRSLHELLVMWQRNEAFGAGLAGMDLSQPANIRALALFESRRRILYVHLRARKREAGRLEPMPRAAGL